MKPDFALFRTAARIISPERGASNPDAHSIAWSDNG
jgi:hypothetical protein